VVPLADHARPTPPAPLSERVNEASAAYIKRISEHPNGFQLLVRRPGPWGRLRITGVGRPPF